MRLEREGQIEKFLQVNNLQKVFVTEEGNHEVLKDINFTIRENEFVVILGPGQCGKSTLLNIIAGLDTDVHGEIYIDSEKVTKPGPDRAMVYQNIRLFPWLTVMGNVEFSPKSRGVDKKTRQIDAQKYIDLVGLKGFEKTFPVKLSGGMKQRVGIARAYCAKPKLMIMDEPFGALDAQTRYLMQEEVVRISETEKRTVLFVTNNIEEAIYLADRIIVMTNCPATISHEFNIDLPRPRDYTSDAFLHWRNEIGEVIERTR